MASPIVTDTSAQLNGASLVYGFATTLTDAQVKALPTTPVSVISAPGSGFRIRVLEASFALHASAGAYTNINTTYAVCALSHTDAGGTWLCSPIVNDATLATPIALMTGFFGAAANSVINSSTYQTPYDNGASSGTQEYTAGVIATWAATENVAVYVAIDNNGSGALTGGNSANHLVVTVYYAVEAIA